MFLKVRSFAQKLSDDNILNLSAQLAYYMLMSFFPFLIVIVSLVGVFFTNNVDVLHYIVSFLPTTVSGLILDNAQYIYGARSTAVLSVSFLVTLWLSMRGVKTVMNALDVVYGNEDERGYIKFHLYAAMNLLIIVATILACVCLVVWLGLDIAFDQQSGVFLVVRGLLAFFLLFIGLLFVNSFMPAKKIHVKYTAIGSLFSAVALIVSSLGFGYYVTNIWQYNRIYGTIGTVVVFLVWLFMAGVILLLGSELNHYLYGDRFR